jgi:heptosyltransferase-2
VPRKKLANRKRNRLIAPSKKIIIRAPNWIGDSILSIPAITSLHSNFHDAEIWVAATDWVRDIYSSFDFIRGIFPLPDNDSTREWSRSARSLRSHGFDIGLLLTNSFSSALHFYQAKIPERWGYKKDLRSVFLSRSIPAPKKEVVRHQVEYYLDLVSALGFERIPPRLQLPLNEGENEKATAYLNSTGRTPSRPLVVFSPGASYGPAKRWPASSFAELGKLLLTRCDADLAVIGSANESDLAEEISSGLSQKPMILTGKIPLRLTAAVIKQAELFITNDSGPMHMANALGIPTVAIFGPTDPRRTGPFQEPSSVLKKDVPCSPCLYRVCPFDHPCMKMIHPRDVLEAGERYLG